MKTQTEKLFADGIIQPNDFYEIQQFGYYSKKPMHAIFYQIEIQENSIPKTAFTVDNGLKNATATFQRLMNSVVYRSTSVSLNAEFGRSFYRNCSP